MNPDPPRTAPPPNASSASTEELLAARRAKLDKLRSEHGIDPFGTRQDGLVSLAAARALYDAEADRWFKEDPASGDDRPIVAVAGRVVQQRLMGNLLFLSLRDHSGVDLQVAVSKKAVGPEAFKVAKLVDLADLVAARGPLAQTKTGEVTVWAGPGGDPSADPDASSVGIEHREDPTGGLTFRLLTKSLALPPGKFHGLTDPEQRYRRRHVDLWSNPEGLATLQTRSRLIKATRDFFEGRGFLEVETPMMQPVPGGAAARPFVTHHNALDLELFLRIAPELYLKRLLVGGLPRVFEINRNFRNEGVDRSHNPEFTMLELYEAYGDLESILHHTQGLVEHLAGEVLGSLKRPYGDHEIDFGAFRRASYHDLFAEHNGWDARGEKGAARVLAKARALGLQTGGVHPDVLLNALWEETVEKHLIQPTFVVEYPASLCPLTKRKPDDPTIAERFELFVAGMELANAYTELNDPDVQEANFREQLGGDAEENTFRNLDLDFLDALKVGMPPAGGLGIGIDRLVMLLTNKSSIRDVLAFPLMKPVGTHPLRGSSEEAEKRRSEEVSK
ncbi:lysine--tRNA ligase [Phycisphaera mikurensis]|uniref:Lysine--tRNA ligase n=1 Tax=Phycisphaera mikurensis (strain NBRC 102666 / KCTC 22515 / FYK2301M01) TaxID=1142394 RepID=I0IDR7_PHYMF|nr:lysine--tRNA ligase [Phycisphaera mikurensis]MBB6441218.1 lysyl-tRNA synthetase class 2 [Phycisphaera mikurensis]BAM03405.1 lysyl-tRNA synthetase [Phycisphaera mikurensis NBRC 102666]